MTVTTTDDDFMELFADVQAEFDEAADNPSGTGDEDQVENIDGDDDTMSDSSGEDSVDLEPDTDTDVSDVEDVDPDDPLDDDAGLDEDDDPDDGESWDDWTAYLKMEVPVKVNGVTENVTLDELRSGYMQQAAATQRFQEASRLMEEAEGLQEAATWAYGFHEEWQKDPQKVLQELAAAANVPSPVGADPYAASPDDDPDIAALKQTFRQEMAALRSEIAGVGDTARQTQEQARRAELAAKVRSEVKVLTDELGEDFDPQQAFAYANEKRIPLRDAAYVLVGQKAREARAAAASSVGQVETRLQQSSKQRAAKRGRAKKSVAGQIRSGVSVGAGESVDDFDDIDDLFVQVAREQGLDLDDTVGTL